MPAGFFLQGPKKSKAYLESYQKIYDEAFLQKQLSFTIFAKKLHHSCLTGC